MTEISRQVESAHAADCVLIICADAQQRASLSKPFTVSGFELAEANSITDASTFARKEIVDLVVCCSPCDDLDLAGRVAAVAMDANLGRAAILHLYGKEEDPKGLSLSRKHSELTQFLPLGSSASELMVKASTLLRLRKIQAEQRRSDADVKSSNLRLRDLTSRFQRELEEAKQIQAAILPKQLPKSQHAVFAAAYLPVDTVGGDLYDVWELGPERFGIIIADVTGHGLPAAFIGAMTKMALSYATQDCPGAILKDINHGLEALMPEGRFVTATAAVFDAASGAFHAACAGHPPPIILRSAGAIEIPQLRGLPLGIAPDASYEVHRSELEPGSCALFVTDGITETQNLAGAMLGAEGVAESFARSSSDKLSEQLRCVLEEQERFAEGRIIKDDVTLVAVKRSKAI
ncbi:MAG: PP2C family protein-serine/threonine phosphatase [Bdellovibrionales bacterium]|nr:PP2C family protein-serine/threonine phosphatase [Bdellovibrionales bacterium]